MKEMPLLLKDATIEEAPLILPPAPEGKEIVADYAYMGLTLNRHPLMLLRERLRKMRLSSAQELQSFPDRRLARTAGMVRGRQRPQTAKGTLFMTLEDETGNTNVIIWPDLLERQRKEIVNSRLLVVYGVWQRVGEVTHLLAQYVEDHSYLIGELEVSSRNFH